MNTTFIYILTDPEIGDPRYVGKANDPYKRWDNGHLNRCMKNTSIHNFAWIKSILVRGRKPNIEIIDEVPYEEWQFWERHYISLYKSWGFNLTNSTDGGDGVENPSIESRRRMGNRNPKTKEQKERLRLLRLGVEPWNKGLKGVYSKETIDNISNSLKGHISWNKGIRNSKNSINKMIESHKGQIPWNKGKKGAQVAWNKGLTISSKLVLNTQTGIFYCSINEAAITHNISRSYLWNMLHNRQNNNTNLILA